jgi:hypothetical protein
MDLWRAQVFFLGDLIEDDFSDLDAAKEWAEATMRGKGPSQSLQGRGGQRRRGRFVTERLRAHLPEGLSRQGTPKQ